MAADGSVVIEILGDVSEITKSLNDVSKEAKEKITESISGVGDSVASATKEIAAASEQGKKSISDYRKDVMALAQTYKTEGMSMSDAMKKAYAEIDKSQYETSEKAEEYSKKYSDSWASSIVSANLITEGIKTVSSSMIDLAKSVVEVGAQFDTSMSQVAATMGLSSEEIQNGSEAFNILSDAAKQAGATTAFSASQAADALNYLALAGYDAATAAEVLPSVLNLAAAGGMDLAYASDLATDAMAALGIEASKANLESFGDQLAAAASNANASVSQLGEAILTVGGTAKSLAGGTVELNAALGILANRGIKSAEGGTALRNIILSLSAPTDKAAKLMDQLGVSAYDAEGKMRPLNETFKDLDAAMQGMSEGEKTNVLNEIFNKVDLKSAQALLAGTGAEFDALSAAISNSAGAMQNMADVQLDNLAGDMTKFQSASEAAGIALSSTLIPSLRSVVQAVTGVIGFAGEALEKFPALGSVFAGVAAGAATLTVGMGAMAVAGAVTGGAVTTLTGAVTTLGASLLASPVAPFALAIGGAVTAFTLFKNGALSAKDANDALRESLEETKESLAESVDTASQSGERLQGMAEALIQLADAESRSSVQTQAMLEMIRQLNEAVPGLNLAYDEQTGQLNMTADAIRNLASAEAERLVGQEVVKTYNDLLAQQAVLTQQAAQAEAEYQAAIDRTNAAREMINAGMESESETLDELYEKQADAHKVYNDLEIQLHDLRAAIKEIEDEYGEFAVSTEDSADATTGALDAAQELSAEMEALDSTSEALKETTLELTEANKTLSGALKEQTENGSISLETANKLIDAGYGAVLAIDTESGAVTLNRDLYLQLAKAKIDEQVATLQAAAASLQAKINAQDEMMAVAGTAETYFRAAEAKREMEGQKVGYDAQIAALNRLKKTIGTVSTAATDSARRTSSASKQVKTQAEKDLEEFKRIKAEMDHQRSMDAISEEEYYKKLIEYRDRYLADESNVSTYRSITEQIYKYDKTLAQNEQELWAQQTDTWADELEDRLKEVQNQQQKTRESLSNFGDLFTIEDDVMSLESIQNQIDAIEAYGNAIQALKDRGVSESLLDQVLGMDEEKATQYANQLLAMSESQYDEYLSLWDEKQAAAARVSSEIYQDELSALQTEFLDKIPEAAEQLPDELKPIGEDAVRALTDGIEETKAEAVAAAADTVDEILEQFRRLDNLSDMLKSAVAAESSNLTAKLTVASNAPAEARAARDRTNAYQNAAANASLGNSVYPSVDVTLTMDGDVLAKKQVDPMRRAFAERPEVLDDD